MKERNIGRIIIIAAFVIIVCCSKGIWFFAEKYLDSANYENRQMATRPVLTLDSYENFGSITFSVCLMVTGYVRHP